MNILLKIVLAVAITLFYTNCSNNQPKTQLPPVAEANGNYLEINTDGINYKIPFPVELFLTLENDGIHYINESLNPATQKEKYQTTYKKAVNFGVYAADMAYCSVFADYQQTLDYFQTIKYLAQELDLYGGFGEQLAERINKNLNNVDSLIDISTESYAEISEYLDEQGLSDLQCLIIAGGWIEGLYICFTSVGSSKPTPVMSQRVTDQQILLENLILYLKNNQQSANVITILEKLEDLQEEYDALYLNNENELITQQQFANIANKVIEIRDEIVL
jgi:hypothetical protein